MSCSNSLKGDKNSVSYQNGLFKFLCSNCKLQTVDECDSLGKTLPQGQIPSKVNPKNI